MDLTEGIREVVLIETFTGQIFNLHMFEKPADLQSGSVIEMVSNWYMDNIVKDLNGASVMFVHLRQILDIETLEVSFCVQAGQAITFRRILVEAVGAVLEEKAPLIFSLLSGTSKHLPDEIPEKAYDSSWSLLPYLCAAFMVSTLWSTTSFDVSTGGFNNNMHCLARFSSKARNKLSVISTFFCSLETSNPNCFLL
ncbi:hypothetical protein M5K25_024874 [Dendrobium thyrsiflorum]|uniref:Uncharacterized protein n=1 Tax=Dendrobium thyrsiflorum TaxID=117978 RepID=A0ABD0U311_DENTH